MPEKPPLGFSPNPVIAFYDNSLPKEKTSLNQLFLPLNMSLDARSPLTVRVIAWCDYGFNQTHDFSLTCFLI